MSSRMKQGERRAKVAELIADSPEMSSREIARRLAIDHKTAASDRRHLAGEIPRAEQSPDSSEVRMETAAVEEELPAEEQAGPSEAETVEKEFRLREAVDRWKDRRQAAWRAISPEEQRARNQAVIQAVGAAYRDLRPEQREGAIRHLVWSKMGAEQGDPFPGDLPEVPVPKEHPSRTHLVRANAYLQLAIAGAEGDSSLQFRIDKLSRQLVATLATADQRIHLLQAGQ